MPMEAREQVQYLYSSANNAFQLAKKTMKHEISVEKISLLSEMTETVIIAIPLLPNLRFFADVYLAEEEKLLSYIPIPEREVLFMRNKARLLELDGEYASAINTLIAAKSYVDSNPNSFRLFEVNYQICRTAMRHWADLPAQLRLAGKQALDEALSFPLDNDNEYLGVLMQTKHIIQEKLQQLE